MAHGNEQSLTVIERRKLWRAFDFRELGQYRELLLFFIWRDLKVRYKQTVLGVAWAVLQPLLGMLIFTIFFGRMAHVPSDGVPYPLFSYTGLLVWTFFAQGVAMAANSLINSSQLITKVYFPRMLVPAAAVIAGLVDLVVAFPFLLVLMARYHVWPGLEALLLPFIILLALCTTLGVAFWLAALNVEYRDIRYVVPFLLQMWLFITPVIYPSSIAVPVLDRLGLPRWILGLNPMTGVVEGFRWSLLGSPSIPAPEMMASIVSAVVFLMTGAIYFRSVERSFADVV